MRWATEAFAMRRSGVRIPSAPLIGTLYDLRKRRRMDRVSCYLSSQMASRDST